MSPKILCIAHFQMSNEFAQKIKTYEKNALQRLKTNLKDDIFESSCVFTGSAGIALLHYLYAKKSKNDKIGSLIVSIPRNFLIFNIGKISILECFGLF